LSTTCHHRATTAAAKRALIDAGAASVEIAVLAAVA
jgi:hypothetical protein